jgi:hypothetical protein
MKKNPFVYLILSLIIALGSCYDAVFYTISVAPPIADPLISGSPTNFVVFDNKMYAASGGNVYSYDGTDWERIPSQPGGRVMQLAATYNCLYALCYKDSENSTFLKRIWRSPPNIWEDVTGETGGFNMLQSVYAAHNKVFIGAERNGSFIILYIDEVYDYSSFKPLTQGGTSDAPIAMLCGLAYDSSNYYLCTRNNTIFVAPLDTPETISETVSPIKIDGVRFTGIVNLGINNTIIAISRNGNLYNVSPTGITQVPDVSFPEISRDVNYSSTGALTVWRETDGTPKLLLAGRQDELKYTVNSGYIYGYLELALDSVGIKSGENFIEPGRNSPSSVADYERYVSTIGKYPVNHIFQTPARIDANMTLFASTQKNGVWSYRLRGDVPQWNAEE